MRRVAAAFVLILTAGAARASKPSAASSDMVPQFGHRDPVLVLVMSPRGDLLASASMGGDFKLWRRDGLLVREMPSKSQVCSAAFSEDGTRIFWLAHNSSLMYQDVSGGEVGTMDLPGYWRDYMCRNTVSIPSSGKVWTATGMGSLSVRGPGGDDSHELHRRVAHAVGWDPVRHDVKTESSMVPFRVEGIVPDPIGRGVVVWQGKGDFLRPSEDGEVESLWSEEAPVSGAVASGDGKMLLVWSHRLGGDRGWVRLRKRNGELIKEVEGDGGVYGAAFLPGDAGFCAVSREVACFDLAGTKTEAFVPDSRPMSLAVGASGALFVGHADGTLVLYAGNGTRLAEFGARPERNISLAIEADGNRIALGSASGEVALWSGDGALVNVFKTPSPPQALAFSPDGSVLAVGGRDGRVRLFGPGGELEQCINSCKPFSRDSIYDVAFGPGSSRLAVADGERAWIWDRDGERLSPLEAPVPPPAQQPRFVLTNGIADVRPVLRSPPPPVRAVAFSGDRVAFSSAASVHVLDSHLRPVQELLVKSTDVVTRVAFLGDGSGVCAGTGFGESFVWDSGGRYVDGGIYGHNPAVGLGSVMTNFGWDCAYIGPQSPLILPSREHATNAGPAAGLAVTSDGLRVVTASTDGTAHVWNKKTGGEMTLLRSGRRWAMYSRDGFFDASGDGGGLVAMTRGTEVFGVDQFAVWSNRPDLILSRVEMGDSETVRDFAEQHRRRAARLGSSGERPVGPLHAPEAEIAAVPAGGWAEVKVACSGKGADIASWRLWANDVPIEGDMEGIPSSREMRGSRRVALAHGINKLEASCIDKAGVESLRAQTLVRRPGKGRERVFYLGVGVSRYADKAISLEYADKDALDLGAALGRAERGSAEVVKRTLVNEQATRAALRRSRAFLEEAGLDDTLVMYLAGHGVHEGADFYFLTHDADPGAIAKTAVGLDEIEGLLAGLKVRRKLLLLDACESGELDGSEQALLTSIPGSRGLRPRASRDIRLRRLGAGARPESRLRPDRFIYNDLIRRTGTVVFSSSRGFERSYESEALKNGLFSSAFIRALGTAAADKDKDGRLSKAELLGFVASSVAEQSGGLQHPVIDRDNIVETLNFPAGRR